MWAGVLAFEVGEWLVGVEFDSPRTADLVRAAATSWNEVEADGVEPAFGVREARVGWRRRRVGVLHHGEPVRLRAASVDDAVVGLMAIFADLERESGPSTIRVSSRLFVRGDVAVLVDVPQATDVPSSSLEHDGVLEVPTWRPVVEPGDPPRVRSGTSEYRLVGVGAVTPVDLGLDDARLRVWGSAEGDLHAWAWILDSLNECVLVRTEPAIVVTDLFRRSDRYGSQDQGTRKADV